MLFRSAAVAECPLTARGQQLVFAGVLESGTSLRYVVEVQQSGQLQDSVEFSGVAEWPSGNSAFNAAPYSLNGQPVVKPSYARENFGFNIGGPLRIPKLVTNDKLLFYINYQGGRNINASNQAASLPTHRTGKKPSPKCASE